MSAQQNAQRVRYLTSKEFSLLFVRTVQRFPCIWNRNLAENRSIIVLRLAWQQVAQTLGNGLTAQQCQTRWRSMRNRYTAHLRKDARNGTNSLHMNGVMEFLRPHTASKAASPADNGNESSSDCEVVEEPAVSAGAQELVELSDDEPEVTTTTTNGYYRDAVDNLDGYEDAPAACQHVRINSSDGDALFLLSMLPEMEVMDEGQKQSFKDTVQTLVKEFMD